MRKSTDSCEQLSGVCDTQFAGFDKPISQNSACNRDNPHHQIRQRRVQSILFSKRISFKIHRANIDINPYIEKCRTSDMYFGRSVTIMKNPQSCPIWAQMRASIGALVIIMSHGVEGSVLSRVSCPSSFFKYSFSLSLMNGCDPGSL